MTDPPAPAEPPLGSDATPEHGTPEGRRIIELLWAGPPTATRGPKAKVTMSDIVQAGIAVADAEGLADLSMRRVANRLGVSVMSLYTHVPGRSELLELMIDRVYGEHRLPDRTLGWRERIEFIVRQRWQLFERHPWLLDYNANRLPLGPLVLDAEEALYAAVMATGLRGTDVVAVTNQILWQLTGAARAQIGDAAEERWTGTSTEAYWTSRMSFWVTYFDPQRFPTMADIWERGGFDDEAGYDADRGVTRLLDALALMLEHGLLSTEQPRTD
jgi:AcrR family transcriptional regulator